MEVSEMSPLRWRCTHRALLEMDLLLGSFLDTQFPNLNAEQVAAFVVLAEMEDHDLWPMIMGKRACADPVQVEVLAMLRNVRQK